MTPTRRRLAIAVMPRLLSDLLSRVLEREDRDVVVVGSPSSAAGGQGVGGRRDHFDIALVSDDAPDVAASFVICLPDTPVGVAHIGGEPVAFSDLESLIALVDRCAAALETRSWSLPGL